MSPLHWLPDEHSPVEEPDEVAAVVATGAATGATTAGVVEAGGVDTEIEDSGT